MIHIVTHIVDDKTRVTDADFWWNGLMHWISCAFPPFHVNVLEEIECHCSHCIALRIHIFGSIYPRIHVLLMTFVTSSQHYSSFLDLKIHIWSPDRQRQVSLITSNKAISAWQKNRFWQHALRVLPLDESQVSGVRWTKLWQKWCNRLSSEFPG